MSAPGSQQDYVPELKTIRGICHHLAKDIKAVTGGKTLWSFMAFKILWLA
jgi:hypothetical protein